MRLVTTAVGAVAVAAVLGAVGVAYVVWRTVEQIDGGWVFA